MFEIKIRYDEKTYSTLCRIYINIYRVLFILSKHKSYPYFPKKGIKKSCPYMKIGVKTRWLLLVLASGIDLSLCYSMIE